MIFLEGIIGEIDVRLRGFLFVNDLPAKGIYISNDWITEISLGLLTFFSCGLKDLHFSLATLPLSRRGRFMMSGFFFL